jgi:hypothetical protein
LISVRSTYTCGTPQAHHGRDQTTVWPRAIAMPVLEFMLESFVSFILVQCHTVLHAGRH